jgi:5-methylcytosine-specific restriction protein A
MDRSHAGHPDPAPREAPRVPSLRGVCHLSGRKIKTGEPWDCDHVKALINGGENRESNLAPALRDKHREKTAEDVAEKSHVYRMAAKHNGTWPKSKAKIEGRGFERSRKAPSVPQGESRWSGGEADCETSPNTSIISNQGKPSS